MPKTQPGSPATLGATPQGNLTNFAIFSEHATRASLCVFHPKKKTLLEEISMNKTDKVWHIAIEGWDKNLAYAYRFDGPDDKKAGHFFNKEILVSDPYGKEILSSKEWGGKKGTPWLCKVVDDLPFPWENIPRPNIPLQDLIIYEMHVRGFTIHPSSKVKHPGTYLGVIEKIPYLKELGVNAVELMPIFEFDETTKKDTNPVTNKPLYNYWGYSTLNFFCPMNRFASENDPSSVRDQFRTMVKELHRNGIEIILDVVYNHTVEGEYRSECVSFKGIDNIVYYMWDPSGQYYNYTGCGNTFNCNHPAAMQLILDSLRYWTDTMGVDGFRFDLASILTRDSKGGTMADPPLIKAISSDPTFEKVKLISEPWDPGGLYQVGHFPSWGQWSEWNDQFRDAVRRFIKGTDGQASAFATALCGSENLYGRYGRPQCSINFITAHDGYTLYDLVSYQRKHNTENAENNRDGANNNENWNCGHEGPSKNPDILSLRKKQMRNFILSLFLAQGVPMMLMGDEYAHTRKGNNNAWCQDSEVNWFLWDQIENNPGLFRFFQKMIQFRKNHPFLRQTHFVKDPNITWHGIVPAHPHWRREKRLLAFTIRAPNNEDLYIAFNSKAQSIEIHLPQPPVGKKWYYILATFMPPPDDFLADPKTEPPLETTLTLSPYCAILAKAL